MLPGRVTDDTAALCQLGTFRTIIIPHVAATSSQWSLLLEGGGHCWFLRPLLLLPCHLSLWAFCDFHCSDDSALYTDLPLHLERGCFISSSFDVADSFGSFAPLVHDMCRVLIATTVQL